MDTILDGGKWFTAKDAKKLLGVVYKIIEDAMSIEWKDAKELLGVVYKIIEDAMSIEWRKEFPNRDETMYERML